MLAAIANKIKFFRRSDKGAVLIFVGLLLLPMLLMLGLAVDSSFGLAEKRKLQGAADAAAKAGGINGGGNASKTTSEAQKVFSANTMGMTGISGPNVNVDTTAKKVTVSAAVTVNNVFMVLGGMATSTYNATATAPLANDDLAEISIVYELSSRFQGNGYHIKVCNALISFINSLPSNVMVSITPITTEFLLDPTTTVPGALFNHLSSTTNDESASPGLYPLGPSLAWTYANYDNATNLFYTSGSYATFPTEPSVLVSNPSPGTCKIPIPNYPSCSLVMWPLKCPLTTKTSCSQVYSYQSNPTFPILPLTLNKTLIVNYINAMKNYTATSDGSFISLISWAWRTIDPAWNDFWMTNSNASSTTRTVGSYPGSYGGKQKSMIIILYGDTYWDDYATTTSNLYTNTCGDATNVNNGLNHWWNTAYGMVPVPTNNQSAVNDITCENRWYNVMDKSLGLALSDSTNYNATVTTSAYQTAILNEVRAKFFRICTNVKAKNIDIYMLSNTTLSTLSPCCNTSANAFTITNANSDILAKMMSIQSKIVAKIS